MMKIYYTWAVYDYHKEIIFETKKFEKSSHHRINMCNHFTHIISIISILPVLRL